MMTYKKIKDFISEVTPNKLFFSLKEKEFYNYLKKERDFEMSAGIANWMKQSIPEKYCIDNKIAIYAFGHFFICDLESNQVTVNYVKPDVKHVYDYEKSGSYTFYEESEAYLSLLKNAVDKYETESEYRPSNYSKIEYREIPNSAYDSNYSLTTEEKQRVVEWQNKHFKKYHTPEYQGAIGVSNFEIRFRATSIGVYADCVCTACEKVAKESNNDKLLKKSSYSIRNLV